MVTFKLNCTKFTPITMFIIMFYLLFILFMNRYNIV